MKEEKLLNYQKRELHHQARTHMPGARSAFAFPTLPLKSIRVWKCPKKGDTHQQMR